MKFYKLLETILNEKILYHGSNKKFSDFDFKNGVWLISDETEAEEYGNIVYKVSFKSDNPYISSHKENVTLGSEKLIKKAREKGYDSIYIPADKKFADDHVYYEGEHDVWIALKPEQIKIISVEDGSNP